MANKVFIGGIGAVEKDKIYAAFYYKSSKDYLNDDWSIKDVASSIYSISKKANDRLEKSTNKIAAIKIYD